MRYASDMLHSETSPGESVAELKALVEMLRTENKLLHQKVRLLLKRLFGSKSEALNPAQLQLLMAGLEVGELSAPDEDDPPPSSPSPGGSKKRRGSKPRIPENLPTEDVRLDPEEVKAAPLAYKRIGEEVTREIDVIPPQYFCRRIIRGKYVKLDDKAASPIIAPLPERLIEGSGSTPQKCATAAKRFGLIYHSCVRSPLGRYTPENCAFVYGCIRSRCI